jgi:hypothetical protein
MSWSSCARRYAFEPGWRCYDEPPIHSDSKPGVEPPIKLTWRWEQDQRLYVMVLNTIIFYAAGHP